MITTRAIAQSASSTMRITAGFVGVLTALNG